jgi:beta-glucanase (GH16 family)
LHAAPGSPDDRPVKAFGRALFLCAVLLFSIMAAPARSATPGFVDDFAAFDEDRWTAGEHPLGRSLLEPANVRVERGRLALAVPAGTTNGAEVRTTATYGFGRFGARIRAASAPSSITGFFLYAPPDYASEIDVEIIGDRSGTVLLTTYAGGRETHHERRALGFDPTGAAHDYRIDWSRGAAAFAVDGRVLRRWTSGIPKAPMSLYVNAWFPRWLDGIAPPVQAWTLVQRVEVRQR